MFKQLSQLAAIVLVASFLFVWLPFERLSTWLRPLLQWMLEGMATRPGVRNSYGRSQPAGSLVEVLVDVPIAAALFVLFMSLSFVIAVAIMRLIVRGSALQMNRLALRMMVLGAAGASVVVVVARVSWEAWVTLSEVSSSAGYNVVPDEYVAFLITLAGACLWCVAASLSGIRHGLLRAHAADQTIVCAGCGYRLSDRNARYCPECGLTNPGETVAERLRRSKGYRIIRLVTMVCAVLLLIAPLLSPPIRRILALVQA